MGIFDSLYSSSGNGILGYSDQPLTNPWADQRDDWLARLMRGDQSGGPYTPPPPMYSEPNGDPSGSQPYTPKPDPYNLGVMPRQSDVIDTGSYAPKPQKAPAQDRPLLRPGSPLAQLAGMFSGGGTAQTAPQQTLAFGSGAQPFPFANMVPGGAAQPPQAAVALPTPRPQMQDIAPNGLDRNMTALPSQFASMDGTNPQNGNFPGYSPSPSALDAIPPNDQLAGTARQPVPAPTQEAPQSRGGLGDGFRGLMANAHTGPIGMLLGGIAGVAGMGEGTPAQIAAQKQKQMFQGYQQLFISRGMPQAQASSLAMIATMNPKVAEEMMKSPANMEAAIANPYLGTGGAGGVNVGANNPAIQYKANEKAALTRAEAIGKAQASYPADISVASDTVKAVNDYLADPNLSSIVGMFAGRVPKEIMTEGQRSALARHDQLSGKVFLTAFTMLEGGGQITEVEGNKAQAAQARMDRAVSEKDYREALEEFKQAVSDGARKLSEATGNPVPDFASGRGAPVSRVPAPPPGFMPIKPRAQ